MTKPKLAELLDLDAAQVLMDALYRATGIKNTLMDADNHILTAAGWEKACTDYHRANPRSCERCLESDRYIFSHLGEGKYVGYHCLNGLMDYATPVIVEGEHLGNIFTGQLLHEPPDMEFFRRQAKEFGYDEEPYLEAVRHVPVVSKERMPDIMAFLGELAEFIGNQGAIQLRLRKENAERRKAEAEATRNAEKLEDAYKELEAFSYSVSHDLRTPLRAVDGFSRMLLEDYDDKLDEDGRHMLDVVRTNAMRMNCLIDDILAFSRTGRTEMRMGPVDMAATARSALEDLKHAMEGRDVKIDIAPLPDTFGDNVMLRQVFVNLLSNAIKFTRPREHAVVEVTGHAEGDEIVYCVRDNGVGFDMQYVHKLFGVFQRLHSMEEFEGTGIGLAIVKRIVSRHGGRVWAESAVDKGASFYFSLPHKGEQA